VGRRVLQEIAGGAGAERVEDVLVVVVDRQREDRQRREALADPADSLDARPAGPGR